MGKGNKYLSRDELDKKMLKEFRIKVDKIRQRYKKKQERLNKIGQEIIDHDNNDRIKRFFCFGAKSESFDVSDDTVQFNCQSILDRTSIYTITYNQNSKNSRYVFDIPCIPECREIHSSSWAKLKKYLKTNDVYSIYEDFKSID